jgi:hypothetical protein
MILGNKLGNGVKINEKNGTICFSDHEVELSLNDRQG